MSQAPARETCVWGCNSSLRLYIQESVWYRTTRKPVAVATLDFPIVLYLSVLFSVTPTTANRATLRPR